MQHVAEEKLKKLQEDYKFYEELNSQLEMNQVDLEKARKHAEESAAAQLAKKDAMINDLQDQVCSLALCRHLMAPYPYCLPLTT
jgi:hypothetical protein